MIIFVKNVFVFPSKCSDNLIICIAKDLLKCQSKNCSHIYKILTHGVYIMCSMYVSKKISLSNYCIDSFISS